MKKVVTTIGIVVAGIVVTFGAIKFSLWGYKQFGGYIAGQVVQQMETAETE